MSIETEATWKFIGFIYLEEREAFYQDQSCSCKSSYPSLKSLLDQVTTGTHFLSVSIRFRSVGRPFEPYNRLWERVTSKNYQSVDFRTMIMGPTNYLVDEHDNASLSAFLRSLVNIFSPGELNLAHFLGDKPKDLLILHKGNDPHCQRSAIQNMLVIVATFVLWELFSFAHQVCSITLYYSVELPLIVVWNLFLIHSDACKLHSVSDKSFHYKVQVSRSPKSSFIHLASSWNHSL